MYKTILKLNDTEIVKTYNNMTLDEVRQKFVAEIKQHGFRIDTPVVGWKETGIRDGVHIMEFVYERYALWTNNYEYASAEIQNDSF